MLMMCFQGPSRLVAEEGKSKCAWVTLDDVTMSFIRGKFTCGHIIRTNFLMRKSSVLCAVKNVSLSGSGAPTSQIHVHCLPVLLTFVTSIDKYVLNYIFCNSLVLHF